MKIVFLGTPQIAVSSLEFMIQHSDIEVVAVVTQPDKPAGRGKKLQQSPIKILAEKNNIPVYQPVSIRKDESVIESLKQLKPDFFITFAFGQILSQDVLDIPKYGTVNLHASLLPEYRGANPIQRAIVEGKLFTGVTTMLTDIGVDTGDILLKENIDISENMNSLELAQAIAEISPELLYKTIKGYAQKTVQRVEQNHEIATHASKFKKEDGEIDWKQSAQDIHNQVRGMYPWPSAFAHINSTVVKIIETRLVDTNSGKNPGELISIEKSGVVVSTGEGDIKITQIQPQGKKSMDAYSWANGARVQTGTCFK